MREPKDSNGERVEVGDVVVHMHFPKQRVGVKRVRRAEDRPEWIVYTTLGCSVSTAYTIVEKLIGPTIVERKRWRSCEACGEVPDTFVHRTSTDKFVCLTCYKGKTRLERVTLDWEPDPYKQGPVCPRELMLPSVCINDVPDLGRRFVTIPNFACTPNEPSTFWVRYLENDHARPALMVDDPSGDDVAADYDWRTDR